MQTRQGRKKFKSRSVILILGILSLAACSPSVEDGVAEYNAKNYEKAKEIFSKREGDATSLFYQYQMSFYGIGVKKDRDHGMALLKRSAEQSQPDALLELGNRSLKGDYTQKNAELGLGMLERAASLGKLEALVVIGNYYINNNQSSLGLSYLKKVENTDFGKIALAAAYESGSSGVPLDLGRALDYWRQAAEMRTERSVYAKVVYAEHYYYGAGTNRDPESAVNILKPLLERKGETPYERMWNREAKAFYAWLLFRGEGLKKDDAEASRIWLGLVGQNEEGLRENFVLPYLYLGLYKIYSSESNPGRDKEKAGLYLGRIVPIYGGEYWKGVMEWGEAEKNDNLKCSFNNALIRSIVEPRYRWIASQAFLEKGRCFLRKAIVDEKGRSESLFEATMALRDAQELGAYEAGILLGRISTMRSNGR